MMARVFIVDDDEKTRKSLSWLIQSVGYETISFPDGKSFLTYYQPEQSGCLILDMLMPQITGAELQELLTARQINLPIIFVSAQADLSTAVQAMKLGAIDFLTKPVDKQKLIRAINHAIEKNKQQQKMYQEKLKLLMLRDQLSPRELNVMAQLVQGKLGKMVADNLGISIHTVETHRASILKKMKVKTLGELINIAIKYDLVTDDE